jgi:hypothetical protein
MTNAAAASTAGRGQTSSTTSPSVATGVTWTEIREVEARTLTDEQLEAFAVALAFDGLAEVEQVAEQQLAGMRRAVAGLHDDWLERNRS